MSRLPARGDLEPGTLPRLLMELHAAGFQGSLALAREQVQKSFLFHAGAPVHTESNRTSERIADQLKQAGSLSSAEHARLAAYVRQKRCPEAKALLALKLVDARTLLLALKEQLRRGLTECFGWDRGSFALDPEVAPPEATRALAANLYALVQEGIGRHWSPERILADLSPHMGHYPAPGHGLAQVVSQLQLDPSVEALLEALGGEQTLWQLLQDIGTPRTLAAAWVLDASGAVTYRDTPRARGPEQKVEIVVTAAQPAGRPKSRAEAPRSPEAESAPAPSAAGEALALEVADRFARLDDLDHYELLGLEREADAGDVKGAYLAAAKTYHPDVIARAGLDTDIRMRANKVFAEIGRAYATLSDPESRRQYDFSLDGGGVELDAERLATAEGLYRKGEVLLRQGNFKGALEFLEPAAELWPEEAEYQSALGWVLYKKLPSEPERAREHLEAAAVLDPSDQSVMFRLSVVLRALGETGA